ncbi:MAG: hypothetical protein QNI99_22075 [Woeseiaceae bacterium]|nr:hypothetical protein [Woeseiaceae bacterium]
MKELITRLQFMAVAIVLAATASLTPADALAGDGGWRVPGTYYLALDAEPFGLPPGLSLPGMLTLHGDRTAIIVDGGDFGGLPFDARDTAQLGSWRYTLEGAQVVLLFLTADGATGDVRSWQRVHIALRQTNRRTMVGEVNVFQLACDGPAPFPIFNCPDPIENADAFTPASPPDVPVTLRRLSPRTQMPTP